MRDGGWGGKGFFFFFSSFFFTFLEKLFIQFFNKLPEISIVYNFSIVFCLFAKKNLAPYQLVLVKQTAPFPAQLRVFVYLHEFPSHAPGGEIGYIFMFCFPLCVSSDLPNQLPMNPQTVD